MCGYAMPISIECPDADRLPLSRQHIDALIAIWPLNDRLSGHAVGQNSRAPLAHCPGHEIALKREEEFWQPQRVKAVVAVQLRLLL